MSAGTHGWGRAPFQSEGLRYPVHGRQAGLSERGNSQAAGFQKAGLIMLCSLHPAGTSASHSTHLDISLLFN